MPDAIVHTIPGPWETRGDFISAIARSTAADGPVLAAGAFIHEVGQKTHSEWNWAPRDPSVPERFARTLSRFPDVGRSRASLEGHVSVVFVIQSDPGLDQAATAWTHARACLSAGGYGVLVDVSGLSHTPATWTDLEGDDPKTLELHRLSVLHMISDQDGFYSSGMTQFGLPDTFVETSDFSEAVDLARAFERYQLIEEPDLAGGHTFSVAQDAPVWVVSHKPHPYSDMGDIDRSPGMWVLRKQARN